MDPTPERNLFPQFQGVEWEIRVCLWLSPHAHMWMTGNGQVEVQVVV